MNEFSVTRPGRGTGAVVAVLCALAALGGCGGDPAPPAARPPSASPTAPDLTAATTRVTVRLWYFNVRERSAVVEPTSLLTGAQYCARYAIPSSDDACRRKLVATGSNVKLTVPISRKVRRLGFPDLDFTCVDEASSEGTCPVTESEFNTWATMNSPAPARITTDKGTIVEVAALMLL